MKVDSIAIVEDDEKVRHYLAGQIQQHMQVADLRVFGDAETALYELTANPVEMDMSKTITVFDLKTGNQLWEVPFDNCDARLA